MTKLQSMKLKVFHADGSKVTKKRPVIAGETLTVIITNAPPDSQLILNVLPKEGNM